MAGSRSTHSGSPSKLWGKDGTRVGGLQIRLGKGERVEMRGGSLIKKKKKRGREGGQLSWCAFTLRGNRSAEGKRATENILDGDGKA